ncbi:MAG: phytanoyl-CoA dioxygenase family protein [Minicystis sp.]
MLLREALARPGGAVGRGPERYYVEIHPERLRGFVEIVTHPWFVAVCEAALGPKYEIIEIGFDVPGPGAMNQPWHRDFPATATQTERRHLDSLAFNLTTVDVTEDMGPFEIAPGTQWDDPSSFAHGMFPPESMWSRYEALAQRKMPKMGDISARSALTIDRGTANRSNRPRPVLVVGVDAPGAGHAAWHDFQITHAYAETLPASLLAHLPARRVNVLEPIKQAHTIEGLVMAA